MDWGWSRKGKHDHSIDLQYEECLPFLTISYTFHLSYLDATLL